MAAVGQRQVHALIQPLQALIARHGRVKSANADGKLITGQPADHLARLVKTGEKGRYMFGHGHDVAVAGLVPPVVIHLLQVIHIDEDHEGMAARCQHAGTAGKKTFPVKKAGQPVALLLPEHLPEAANLFGNVGDEIKLFLLGHRLPEDKPLLPRWRSNEYQLQFFCRSRFDSLEVAVIKKEAAFSQLTLQPA